LVARALRRRDRAPRIDDSEIADAIPVSPSSASAKTVAVSGETVMLSPSEKTSRPAYRCSSQGRRGCDCRLPEVGSSSGQPWPGLRECRMGAVILPKRYPGLAT
jgi:hypothetical protein